MRKTTCVTTLHSAAAEDVQEAPGLHATVSPAGAGSIVEQSYGDACCYELQRERVQLVDI